MKTHHKKRRSRSNKTRRHSSSRPPEAASAEAVLRVVTESPVGLSKGDIAKRLRIKGDDRRLLREWLQQLVAEQKIILLGNRYSLPKRLPPTIAAEVRVIDHEGDVVASPLQWRERGPKPEIFIPFDAKLKTQPEFGDHILVAVLGEKDGEAIGRIIRILPQRKALGVLGVVRKEKSGWVLESTSRKGEALYRVEERDLNGAKEGEFARAEVMGGGGGATSGRRRPGTEYVRIVEVLGQANAPKAASMMAIHTHELPHVFPKAVVEETRDLPRPALHVAAGGAHSGYQGREDIRDIPLVTIDGEDARDFDDAIWAEPDSDPQNRGGWHLVVAIADVAHYVRAGSALDDEARLRGNSVYFPDRVVPMLPEALSNDLCSLRPDGDRFCLAIHMWIDAEGELLRQRLVRGLMRSRARLTYNQVQRAMDGETDDVTAPLMDTVIRPVYKVFDILLKQRIKRGALEIDLPEYYIDLDEQSSVRDIFPKTRLNSHRVVEEFMILANVAAAMTLQKTKMPALFRNHETPSVEKVEELSHFLESLGQQKIHAASMRPGHFNRIFDMVKDLPIAPVVHIAVLRAQMQAFYGPERLGHFGLALTHYAHFTSPIRRYSDLIVHRALIKGNKLGDDGLTDEEMASLGEIGEHISATERKAMQAEREARERYTAAFLKDKVGQEVVGYVSGMSRSGLFIALEKTGADGFIPLRTLDDDYYIFDERNKYFRGRKSGNYIRLGDKVNVMIEEIVPISGRIRLSLVSVLHSPSGKPSREARKAHFKQRDGRPEREHRNKKGKPGALKRKRRPKQRKKSPRRGS